MIDFWVQHDGPGFHPADAAMIKPDRVVHWTPEEALAHEWDHNTGAYRSKLHANLIPTPYAGNLRNARVFVLTLNPGYRTACYLEDHLDSEYRSAMLDNLRQGRETFPWLDPWLLRSGGYRYWRKVFAPLVMKLGEARGIPASEAASLVGRNVAIVQSCPYHSVGSPGDWVYELPSSRAAKSYVHEVLVPRARAGEISLVVQRAARFWSLDDGEHVLIRKKNFRSAVFTPTEVSEMLRHWT